MILGFWKKEEKIIAQKRTKYVTLTYHKLAEDINIKAHLEDIVNQFNKNIKESKRKTILVVNLTMCKEPYEKESEKNKGYVHIHALIEFNDKIVIHKHEHIAKILTFRINNISYYPHVSACVNKQGYIEYMTKLQRENIKYKNPEYYATLVEIIDIKNTNNIKDDIENIRKNLNIYYKKDVRSLVGKYSEELVNQNKKSIDFIFKMTQEFKEDKEEKNAQHLVEREEDWEYKHKHYINSKNYEKIYNGFLEILEKPRKYSLWIKGKSGSRKTSMVFAALFELEKKYEKPFAIFKIGTMDSSNVINFINKEMYQCTFSIFDDIFFNEKDRRDESKIKHALEGNEFKTSIACRYEDAVYGRNNYKVYINNKYPEEMLKPFLPEYESRIKRIEIDSEEYEVFLIDENKQPN